MPTINLLPPGLQRLQAIDRYRSYALWLLLMIMAALSFTYFGSFYARYRINHQSAILSRQLADVKPAALLFDQISKDANQLASSAKEIVELTDKVHVWPIFFNYIENSVPSDVYVRSISAGPEKGNYAVIISGTATSRKAVGVFREKLLQYKVESEPTERVSQVVIDSINSNPENTEQQFSLRVTMNLEPQS